MNERLSAWMDGELESEQGRQLLAQVKRNGDLRSDWDCYHLIGDTLRGVEGPDLCARICVRLDAEPTVLAPQHRRTTAMPGRFHTAAAASVAAVIFVASVGWMNWPSQKQNSQEIVAIPEIEVKQATVQADEGARDYLYAHQPYSSGNAMHGLAVYVRATTQGMPLRAYKVTKWDAVVGERLLSRGRPKR